MPLAKNIWTPTSIVILLGVIAAIVSIVAASRC